MGAADSRKWFPTTLNEQLELLVKAGLLAGGIFTVVQYVGARQDARLERTARYIDRYETGDVATAQRNIDAALRPYLSQFEALRAAGISEEARRQAVLTLVEESQEGGLGDEIDVVTSFYSGLHTCVHNNLCDRQTALAYFETDAQTFWVNFEPYVTWRRGNNASYGVGVERFAETAHADDG